MKKRVLSLFLSLTCAATGLSIPQTVYAEEAAQQTIQAEQISAEQIEEVESPETEAKQAHLQPVSSIEQHPSSEETVFEEIAESVVILEDRVSLEEAIDALPESLEAYDEESGDAVSVPVTWECIDDYDDTGLSSYVFEAVPLETEIEATSLPRVEIYYASEFTDLRPGTDAPLLVQEISPNSLIGETDVVDEKGADTSTSTSTAPKATSAERAFWESLDDDSCLDLTDDQKKFFARLDTALEPYLYENKTAVLAGASQNVSYTEPIPFSDLSSLYFEAGTRGVAYTDPNNVVVLTEAYLNTHPQFFFLTTAYTGTSTYLRVAFLKDFIDPDARAAARTKIQKEFQRVTSNYKGATVKNAQALHDRLCTYATYDSDGWNGARGSQDTWTQGNVMWDQTLASVFYTTGSELDHSSVCAGYSQAYTAMLNYRGIGAFSITSTNHQWNKAYLENAWYCVDCTWDDQTGSENMTYASGAWDPTYTYFMRAEITGDTSHSTQPFWNSLTVGYQATTDYEIKDFSNGESGTLTLTYTLGEDESFDDDSESFSQTIALLDGYALLGSKSVIGPIITKYGYTLSGWKSTGGTNYKLDTTYVNQGETDTELALSASWTPRKYKLSYNYNGGKKGGTMPSTFTVATSGSIPTPKKSGATFAGWYVSDASEASTTVDFAALTKDPAVDKAGSVTLRAAWNYATSYTVEFYANNGEESAVTPAAQSFSRDETITLPIPVNSNSQFVGWAKKKNATKADYKPSAATGAITAKNLAAAGGSITLYEVWKTSWDYTVTYDAAGGEFDEDAETTATYQGNMTYASPIPTRDGYTFTGWKKAGASKVAYKYNTKTAICPVKNASTTSSSVTLTAAWKAITYTVSYTMNGGAKGKGSTTKFTAETAEIQIKAPTKKNADFSGWYQNGETLLSANGTFTLKPSEILADETFQKTGTLRLTAMWTPKTYRVIYNGLGGKIKTISGVLCSRGSVDLSYGTKYTLMSERYITRDGYTLAGWSKTSGGKVNYKLGTAYQNLAKPGKEITLYAVWTKK